MGRSGRASFRRAHDALDLCARYPKLASEGRRLDTGLERSPDDAGLSGRYLGRAFVLPRLASWRRLGRQCLRGPGGLPVIIPDPAPTPPRLHLDRVQQGVELSIVEILEGGGQVGGQGKSGCRLATAARRPHCASRHGSGGLWVVRVGRRRPLTDAHHGPRVPYANRPGKICQNVGCPDPGGTLTLVCAPCRRLGRYRTETLIRTYGPRAGLPDSRRVLAAKGECRGSFNPPRPCAAVYERADGQQGPPPKSLTASGHRASGVL